MPNSQTFSKFQTTPAASLFLSALEHELCFDAMSLGHRSSSVWNSSSFSPVFCTLESLNVLAIYSAGRLSSWLYCLLTTILMPCIPSRVPSIIILCHPILAGHVNLITWSSGVCQLGVLSPNITFPHQPWHMSKTLACTSYHESLHRFGKYITEFG